MADATAGYQILEAENSEELVKKVRSFEKLRGQLILVGGPFFDAWDEDDGGAGESWFQAIVWAPETPGLVLGKLDGKINLGRG